MSLGHMRLSGRFNSGALDLEKLFGDVSEDRLAVLYSFALAFTFVQRLLWRLVKGSEDVEAGSVVVLDRHLRR